MNFDFGYRQTDGSYISADHANDDPDNNPTNIIYSPSAEEFESPNPSFNVTIYCVRCCPCSR